MKDQITTAFSGKSFAVRLLAGWNEPPEELVEEGSVREFEWTLENAWLSVFGEDGV